jgi:hypothetical protein
MKPSLTVRLMSLAIIGGLGYAYASTYNYIDSVTIEGGESGVCGEMVRAATHLAVQAPLHKLAQTEIFEVWGVQQINDNDALPKCSASVITNKGEKTLKFERVVMHEKNYIETHLSF